MVILRPHHLLCILGFRGKGYSSRFVTEFAQLVSSLEDGEKGDNKSIRIVGRADRICHACPNREGHLCEKEGEIKKLDDQHSAALEVSDGSTLTWGDAKKKIKDRISLGVFHQICNGGSWKSLGYCQEALERLRDEIPESV